MSLSFDVISDLNLTSEDKFSWEDKVTSLFCVIPGNISSDLKVIQKTLSYLSELYRGIFYIDGTLEHESIPHRTDRIEKLEKICSTVNNCVFLHNNIVIVNGVGVMAANGWYGQYNRELFVHDGLRVSAYRNDDLEYLNNTVKRIQLHADASKVLMVTSSPPNKDFFFKEDSHITDLMSPDTCLTYDTEKKITNWAFGGGDKKVDTTVNGVNYVSNPFIKTEPYWAKRIEIEI
jgi:hypothetical protein